MKNWGQVIRKKAPYRIEPTISKAQNVVSHLDLGWHLSSKKNIGDHYSFTVCFNILRYDTIFAKSLPTDTPPIPSHSYKMKTQPHTGHRF